MSRVLRVGNCRFLHVRGWGIQREVEKKSGVCPRGGGGGGGMVTARIEPYIRDPLESRPRAAASYRSRFKILS